MDQDLPCRVTSREQKKPQGSMESPPGPSCMRCGTTCGSDGRRVMLADDQTTAKL